MKVKRERIFSFIGFSEIVQYLSACNIAKYCTLGITLIYMAIHFSHTINSIIVWQYMAKFNYRMAKIYCHINQCDASVQYFAILHAVKETHNTKIRSL